MTRIYTMMRLAEEASLHANKPSTSRELWEIAVKLGLDQKLGSQGLTPWDSLSARLVVETRDNPNCNFIRLEGRPAKYFLKNPTAVKDALKQFDTAFDSTESKQDFELAQLRNDADSSLRNGKFPYRERDLHPFLTSFAKYSLGAVVTKTILHEKSGKQNWTEWLHPDLVGFWFPFGDYNTELLALSGNGLSIARFYSFEMKRELNFGNLRESYFQAVSNSSWANEGYLAAANIAESEQLRNELRRLSGSFGIGVIELFLEDPEKSQIICPAKRKPDIDWESANKLAVENRDYRQFLASSRIDISNNKLHESEYDKAPSIEQLKAKWIDWQTQV